MVSLSIKPNSNLKSSWKHPLILWKPKILGGSIDISLSPIVIYHLSGVRCRAHPVKIQNFGHILTRTMLFLSQKSFHVQNGTNCAQYLLFLCYTHNLYLREFSIVSEEIYITRLPGSVPQPFLYFHSFGLSSISQKFRLSSISQKTRSSFIFKNIEVIFHISPSWVITRLHNKTKVTCWKLLS